MRFIKFFSFMITVFLSVSCAILAHADDVIEGVDTSAYEEGVKALSPFMTPDPEMLEKAKKGLTPDFHKRVEKNKDRLLNDVFKGAREVLEFNNARNSTGGKDSKKRIAKGGKILGAEERIYIFVSSSVPMVTLRNYARDLDALGEVGMYMIIRGFIGGGEKARPTLDFIRRVVLKDADCQGQDCDAWKVRMDIDPRVFRKYGVDVVPTVLYETGGGDAYLLQGDISLEGALLEINKRVKSAKLDCLALKLRIGPQGRCAARREEEE